MSGGMVVQAEVEAALPAEASALPGISGGTVVATCEGLLPVDFLEPGDRVVTRAGMRILRAVGVHRYSGPAVSISASALGHDRPEQDLTLPAHTPILVRDWRAGAIYGVDQAFVPAARLIDGEYVRAEVVRGMPLYELVFDTPEVVYAEGVEIACGVAEMAAA